MKTICYYHSRDLDGWTSAAIVKKWHDEHPDDMVSRNSLELIGWDYGDPEPIESEKGIHYIIVDICFSSDVMKMFNDWDTVWIDHHKTAIADSEKYGFSDLNGQRNPEFAACELAWQYFFPKNEMPPAVLWLGAYDSFRHKSFSPANEAEVLMFQYAARALASNPKDAEMFLEVNFSVSAAIMDGYVIYKYLCVDAKSKFERLGFDVEFDGKLFRIINGDRINPKNFELDLPDYDGAGCFWYRSGKWEFSLYALKDIDVSEICRSRGGGGHEGAAGFTVKTIDWDYWKKTLFAEKI